MTRLVIALFRWKTGRSADELAAVWAWHHFTTRSRARAYVRTFLS